MAYIPLTIVPGARSKAPYSVVITDTVTGNAVTCTAGCSNNNALTRNLYFTAFNGPRNYRITVTDSSTPACTYEQLTGIIDCTVTVTNPTFTGTVIHPACNNGELSTGTLQLTGIQNGNRYRLVESSTFVGNDCAASTQFSGATLSLPLGPGISGETRTLTLRVWGGTDCSHYTDQTIQVITPTCVPTQVCSLTLFLGNPIC